MECPKFSVAISVYKSDDPAFFDRALESITDLQTVKPSEIVLVVDGPVPDETNKVIEKYSQKYTFKTIRLETNKGLGNALKLATENASFELIARMDSDDVSINNRFEQQLQFFGKNPDVDIVGGNISEFIDDENKIVSNRIVPTTDKELKKYIKKRCPFNHMTVMFKKKAVLDAGGYQSWFYNEDYYLWIRMALNNAVFANTGTTLVNVRTGLGMYGRRGGKKYFKSEIGIQKYMLKNKMIGHFTYFSNCSKRYIIQRMLPSSVRGWVFRHFARKSKV